MTSPTIFKTVNASSIGENVTPYMNGKNIPPIIKNNE